MKMANQTKNTFEQFNDDFWRCSVGLTIPTLP